MLKRQKSDRQAVNSQCAHHPALTARTSHSPFYTWQRWVLLDLGACFSTLLLRNLGRYLIAQASCAQATLASPRLSDALEAQPVNGPEP